jgi:hypothetical protein
MFKKKKTEINYDRINGYVEGIVDVTRTLTKQMNTYGEIANIKDLLSLIHNDADIVVDKLLDGN